GVDSVVMGYVPPVVAVAAHEADGLLPQRRGGEGLVVDAAEERPLAIEVAPQLGVGLHPAAGVVHARAGAVVEKAGLHDLATTWVVAVEIEGSVGIHIGRHPLAPKIRVVPEPDVEAIILGGAERIGGRVPEPEGAAGGRQAAAA